MSNYSQEGRPALPLLQGVGNKGGEVTTGYAILRGARLLLAILNPVAVVAMWAFLIPLSHVRRLRAWRIVAAGAVATIAALLLGWIATYNTVWRELGNAAVDAARQRDTGVLVEVVSDQWLSWVIAQLPAAICFGLLLAGIVLRYRERYRATWREQKRDASPRQVKHELARLDRTRSRSAAQTPDALPIRLGVDVHSATPRVVPGAAFRMHAAVGGPTGFGKSTTLRRIIDQFVAAPGADNLRVPVVFIDMKGDAGMRRYFHELAAATGRRLHLVTGDSDGRRYNPLLHGTGNQIASLLMETESNAEDGGFSEPHYRALGERLLRLAADVLVELVAAGRQTKHDGSLRPWRRDLPDLVQLMNLDVLARQTERLSPALGRKVARFTQEAASNADLRSGVYGLYNRFALIADGPAGHVLTDAGDGLNLLDAITSGDLVLFSLGSGDAGSARQLGNLAIQDLEKTLGRLPAEFYNEATGGGMVLTILDEFSAIGGSLIAGLYTRSRSFGGATVLASQTLYEDLAAVSPDFPAKVMKNANIIAIHQTRDDDADRWANFFGTHEVWKETIQLTSETGLLGRQDAASGMGSLRQTHEFRVPPDTLRELPRGRAALFIGHPERSVSLVDIAPPPDRTAGEDSPVTARAGARLTGATEAVRRLIRRGDDVDLAALTRPTEQPVTQPEPDTPPSHQDVSPGATGSPVVGDVATTGDDVDLDGDDAPLVELPER